MCINKPFLDNKETVGMISPNPVIGTIGFKGSTQENAETPAWNKRKKYNRDRCLRMTRQVKQNRVSYDDLHNYLEKNKVDDNTLVFLMDFRYKLNTCCHFALFREHLTNGATEFIGAHTCKHKLCAVCNALRAKKSRRIWRTFFEKYPELIENYDFMHLTLTVPHSKSEGFRGKRWYADELMKEFNYMRKKSFWKKHVYAGEFGVEVTKNEQGLHIHIHSLLLVHKSLQNRNKLHKDILKAWNRQTSGSGLRKEISEAEKASIMKGNRLFSLLEVDHLAPDGSTLIGLENLYLRSNENKPGFHYCDHSGHWKKYVKPSDGFDIFMSGIMECIKYHFQPMAMYEDGSLDFDLICEILPSIKGKPLYRKFGAFHAGTKNAHEGAKMLNINYKEDKIGQEMVNELKENGHDEVVNPETGEEALREEYIYFAISLAKVFLDPDDEMKIKIPPNVKKIYLPAANALDALVDLEVMSLARQRNIRNPIIKLHKLKRAC